MAKGCTTRSWRCILLSIQKFFNFLLLGIRKFDAICAKAFAAAICHRAVGGATHYASIGLPPSAKTCYSRSGDDSETHHFRSYGKQTGNEGCYEHFTANTGVASDQYSRFI